MVSLKRFDDGKRFKFLLSSASLAPWSMIPGTESWVLNLAKKAGFDGVEFFLFGRWTDDRVSRVKTLARERGLIVHFHQVWSVSECSDDSSAGKSRVMNKLGLLPNDGYSIRDVCPSNACPLVAYADRYGEISTKNGSEVWFQTLSTFNKLGGKKIECDFFLDQANKENIPLVLDTMHFLEFSLDKRGVHRLPRDGNEILTLLKIYWMQFGLRTREIHFNDYIPGIGDKGRNVFPGSGFVPLRAFSLVVGFSGWCGYITPEINPSLPFPHSLSTFKKLRNFLRSCWGE